jgi:DNA-binding MarR family transcriptional regulator
MPYTMLNELQQKKPFTTSREELYFSLAFTVDKLHRQVEETLKSSGLSEPQYNVLCILKAADPEAMSCSQIGNRMVTRDPDVTRLLDRLERSGLVERQRATVDRRVIQVKISPAGLTLANALEHPILDLHEKQLSCFEEATVQKLLEELTCVRKGLGIMPEIAFR